jgi:hypothetical protein
MDMSMQIIHNALEDASLFGALSHDGESLPATRGVLDALLEPVEPAVATAQLVAAADTGFKRKSPAKIATPSNDRERIGLVHETSKLELGDSNPPAATTLNEGLPEKDQALNTGSKVGSHEKREEGRQPSSTLGHSCKKSPRQSQKGVAEMCTRPSGDVVGGTPGTSTRAFPDVSATTFPVAATAPSHCQANKSNQCSNLNASCGVRWIILDGPTSGSFSDRLSRLLLGQALRLNTGVCVRVQHAHRILWETDELAGATPALLTSAGICTVQMPLIDDSRLLFGHMDSLLEGLPILGKV